jgi:glyoxylase-like metal-dependent hydrolase (beta-lactamase superfamily II)
VKKLADGVWQLSGYPADLLNVYVIEDVLIDAATRYDGGRILRELRAHTVSAHAITHAHPDHMGSSRELCERLNVPFWVGAGDVAAAEDPAVLEAALLRVPVVGGHVPRNPVLSLFVGLQSGGGQPVSRPLIEGDEVGGFKVLESPGHTSGHIAFWRESDRVLIAGDVAWNVSLFGGRPGLSEPLFPLASVDPALNRDSARRLAALEPSVVCFGHGPPLLDTARFSAWAQSLPVP